MQSFVQAFACPGHFAVIDIHQNACDVCKTTNTTLSWNIYRKSGTKHLKDIAKP